MEDKIYFLPNDQREYSHEEITALIFAGKLVKRSMIWEKSLPDWIYLGDYEDFAKIFQEYDKEAEEKFKRAEGTDEETLQKREMKKMFENVSEEKIKTTTDWRYIFKWVIFGILILLIPAVYFVVNDLTQTGSIFDEEEQQHEKLDLNDLKYRSGLIKIDEIKGVAIKKVEKKEEDKILEEIIIQMRKEDAAKKIKEGKKEKAAKKTASASLFDKVSDEELNAFRKSFLKKAGSANTVKNAKAKDSSFAKGEKTELTSKQINTTIKKNYSTIRHCYERALKTDVGIRGKMEVTLHILGNGKVAKVINNTSRFKGSEMERCVNEIIKDKWQFPKFEGTLTTVTIPFVLSAQ